MRTTDVRRALDLDDSFDGWIAALDAVAPRRPAEARSGRAVGAPEALRVPTEAIPVIARSAAEIERRPELRWLLDRCRDLVTDGLGDDGAPRPAWPLLPDHLGVVAQMFYLHVFLAALPDVRAWHRRHGIPDDVAWTTLADLGRHVVIDSTMFGRPQFASQAWLLRHWRGVLYELGRLQFEQYRRGAVDGALPHFWYAAGARPAAAPELPVGAAALDVHIPWGDPLTPEACGDSFDRARRFFRHHFPDRRYTFATCSSWLLDDQLAEYLPPSSNILRFQRRFEIVPGAQDVTEEMHGFVFQRPLPIELDRLPQRSRLERAFVTHLRQGGRWRIRTGWLAL